MNRGFEDSPQVPYLTERGASPVRDAGLHVKLKVGPGGRVVIPSEVRAGMDIKDGDTLLGVFDGETLSVRPYRRVLAAIQDEMRALVPAGESVVEEFLRERPKLWGEEPSGKG